MFLVSNSVVVLMVMMFPKYLLNWIPQLIVIPLGKPGTNTVFSPKTTK